MSTSKIKCYALKLTAKPKPEGNVRYKSKSFKGIVFAIGPTEAKEKAIEIVIGSVKEPVLTREEVKVNECNPFSDFLFHPKN